MHNKDIRRHRRIPHTGPVRLSWQGSGEPCFAHGKCLDISAEGMLFETQEAVPLGVMVTIRAERLNVSGSAMVKHVRRKGFKYVIGLELSAALREQTLALVGAPQGGVPPAPAA